MSGYCLIAPGDAVHRGYHAHEYGFPVADDRVLFERLCLEIFQAGLSWRLILQRRAAMNAAMDNFDIDTVAGYGEDDFQRLMGDARVIRNRLKLRAIVDNARTVQALQREAGSFKAWLDAAHPRVLEGKAGWVKLMKSRLRFMGREVVGEFLMSTGYLPGAHAADCPIFEQIAAQQPPWLQAERAGFIYRADAAPGAADPAPAGSGS